MTFQKSLIGSVVCAAFLPFAATSVTAQEVNVDRQQLTAADSMQQAQPVKAATSVASYIVQLTGKPGVSQAENIGELKPSNYLAAGTGNRYNAYSAKMAAYNRLLKSKQQAVAQDIGVTDVLYNYTHTFNGFAARLTPQQADALRQRDDVVGVWLDEKYTPNTSNTPTYLGLNSPTGQHTLGIKGEDVIVGIIDTGIWPENPSLADDGSYSAAASLSGWNGTCDAGAEAAAGTFSCNNKLIGARYYKAGFEASYAVQYALGEFDSPRDADGHGTHTATTAAGNENVAASRYGTVIGDVTGIAPRARVAAYKVCWNSDYVSPSGAKERGCFGSDSMAAMDAAVADGVDVLNYSIGGSRTSLTTAATAAMLRAANAGVFVSVSAGNDGPTAVTVGTPAPWVTSVAAGTYTGTSYTNALDIVSRDPVEQVGATEGAITHPLATTGDVTGDVVIASPLQGCFAGGAASALDNAAAINGNIALIQRGSCAFDEKVERAQLAGASAVIVYSDNRPVTVMGGNGSFTIPGMMISGADGEALNTAISGGEAVRVTMSAGAFMPQEETGSVMASFSSRGPNGNTENLIKPDIVAPGVRILAGTTAAPMFEPHGQNYKYLSGTSMSAPHVAGMAALLKGQYPTWSPAQIKSALMTTARQDVVKEDGTTPATPFDFGSGYTVPVAAMNPGLTYELNAGDYYGFLCGLNEATFVASASGTTCSALQTAGFSNDPSQLNYPSIAVSEVANDKTVSRTVKDVSGTGGTYTVNVEAPTGFDVAVKTFDASGTETASSDLEVPANGNASYSLTFSKNAAAVVGEWVFGAVTWSDSSGHVVRSPIALKAAPTIKIEVPATRSITLRRGRASFPVKMLYTGSTRLDYTGLTPAFGSTGTVSQDADRSFTFNEPGLGFHGFLVPAGTKVARFSLRDSLVSEAGSDLDLYVYRCEGFSCSRVATSLNGGSNEDVILTNPEPAANSAAGDFYVVFVHGWDTAGHESVNYTMPVWIVDQVESSTRIRSTPRAIDGRYNNVSIMTRNLTRGLLYMGAITFYDDENQAQGTTVLEVQQP